MTDNELAIKLFEETHLLDLPVGVYLVAKSGEFLRCSSKVREILCLSDSSDIKSIKINSFYLNSQDRDEILQKLLVQEKAGGWLEKQVIAVQVNHEIKYIQLYCRSLNHPISKEIIGYVGCMVDVTEEELYHQLSERLSAVIYRVDSNDKFIYTNNVMAKLFGYNSKDEFRGMHLSKIFANMDDYNSFRKEVVDSRLVQGRSDQSNGIVTKTIDLEKVDGSTFPSSITAALIKTAQGGYGGIVGKIVDNTIEDQSIRIRDEMPLGLYMVRENKSGEDVIVECNDNFAKMYDFESKDDVINITVSKLHKSMEKFGGFIKELKEKKVLQKYIAQIKTNKGRTFTASLNVRLLVNSKGNTIGRVGSVDDVTQEMKMGNHIERLSIDIGQTLHTYSHTLDSTKHFCDYALASSSDMETNCQEYPDYDSIDIKVKSKMSSLIIASQDLIEHGKKIDIDHVGFDLLRFEELINLLIDCESRIESKSELFFTRFEFINTLADTIKNGEKSHIAKESLKVYIGRLVNLQAICSKFLLCQIRDIAIEMDYSVRALREFVTRDDDSQKRNEVCTLSKVLNKSIDNIAPYMVSRKISVKREGWAKKFVIKVNKNDTTRAFTNVLHNAVKYSWGKADSWVTVSVQMQATEVLTTIENYGVPIAENEIADKLIFKIGYRGKFSADRARVGTGIGLADAMRVIEENGGTILVESFPASPSNEATKFKTPFLTRVTIKLPLWFGGGVNEN